MPTRDTSPEDAAPLFTVSDPWTPGARIGWDVTRAREAGAVFNKCGVRPHRPERLTHRETDAEQFVASVPVAIAEMLQQAAGGV